MTLVWKRKFVGITGSKHDLQVAENVLDRQSSSPTPDLAYVSDMTDSRTETGWLYLATVLDLYARKVVGWTMAPGMPVCYALNAAIAQKKPAPIAHSDQGSE